MYKKDCADQWNNIKKYMKSKMKTLLIVLKKIIRKIIRSIKTIIKKIKEGWNNDMSEMDKKKMADEIEKAWERIVYIEKKVFGKEDAAGEKSEVKIERYENSLKELMASVDSLNKKVDNLQSVEEKNESLKKENESLKNKINELNEKLEKKDGELKTKANDLQKLRDEKDSKETKLRKNIEALIEDKTKSEDELRQKKKENQNLDNMYKQIKQEKEQLQKDKIMLETNLTHKTEENEQLQREKTMLENDLRQKVEEKEKLQHDLDEQNEKYGKTNEQLYEKEKEYEELLNSKDEMIRQWSDKTEPYRKVLEKMIHCDSMRRTMKDFGIESKAGSDAFTNVLNFINLIGREDTFLDTLHEDLNDYVNEKETFITEEDKEFFVALNQYYKDRFKVEFDFIFYGQERFDEKKMTDKQDPNHYFKSSMGTYVPGILNDEGILKYKEIVKGKI